MSTYDFKLTFALPGADTNAEQYLDALFEAGCDDALIGIGSVGTIGLDFEREADSASEAIDSAISDVLKAIPGATLLEVGPDLVGVTDIADLVESTRQNIQKFVTSGLFPKPAHFSRTPIWHFYTVATWLASRQLRAIKLEPSVIEASKIAYRVNIEVQKRQLEQTDETSIELGLTA